MTDIDGHVPEILLAEYTPQWEFEILWGVHGPLHDCFFKRLLGATTIVLGKELTLVRYERFIELRWRKRQVRSQNIYVCGSMYISKSLYSGLS